MESTVKLYSLEYNQLKTYLMATLFVVGNILLPQFCHLFHQGGIVWLPIYFFTLVGAYKYGWRVGLLTALASPFVNSMWFGMPAPAVLPIIMAKSVLLAMAAGYAAKLFGRISIPILVGVVLTYQVLGVFAEWAITGSLLDATQDFRLGIPGMLVQILFGYAFVNYLIRR